LQASSKDIAAYSAESGIACVCRAAVATGAVQTHGQIDETHGQIDPRSYAATAAI